MSADPAGITPMDSAAFARFDELCGRVAGQGQGLALVQVRDCHRLAIALGDENPDRREVERLCRGLRLNVEDVLPRERAP